MSTRTIGVALLLALASACATATPVAAKARAATPADPERWARVACQRGEYPVELDNRAYAQARQSDLAAARQGSSPDRATRQLLAARQAFEARCEGWLQVAQATSQPVAPSPFVTAGYRTSL